MIDEKFVEAIVGLAETKIIEVEGRKYSTASIAPVKEPEITVLNVESLTAIKDYLDSNVDALKLDEIIVHIVGPEKVTIFSKVIPPFKQRDYFMAAHPSLRKFSFGQYMGVEQFIIALQALFEDKGDRANIIKLAGNLTDGKTTNFNDDGVTQQVTAKVGVARVENVAIPNPVTLAPYRTFLEVDQPETDFVFRIRSGQGDAPQCALFEADGGAWELEAVSLVKKWLTENLPKGITVLA